MKNRRNKKFSRSSRFNGSFCGVIDKRTADNALTIGVIAILFVLILVCSKLCYGVDLLYQTDQSGIEKASAKTVETEKSVFMESGGAGYVDGSLRVFGTNSALVFDLVEVSTPVAPAANHARLFLRADGSKSSLIVQWDDGTTSRIAGN